MPNGPDRNYIRLCAAINGFFDRYGHWPTRVRIFPEALEDLRDHVFSTESFQILTSKLDMVPDEAPMVAEDDQGNSYSYGESGFPLTRLDLDAQTWIGITPDGPAMY